MADKTNTPKKINNLLDALDKQTQDIFKSTYHATDLNNHMFTKVSSDLSDSIQKAIQSDKNYSDISNTTKLYEKLFSKIPSSGENNPMLGNVDGKGSSDANPFDIFSDTSMLANLMETYSNSKWIRVIDDEIDMCVKYMPKLQTALDIKKDAVLCADSFSKTFINASIENSLHSDNTDRVSTNIDHIINTYDLEKKFEQWYDSTSKYGETFIYIVPYKKAFEELLSRKKNTRYGVNEAVLFENGEEVKPNRPRKRIRAVIEEGGGGSSSIRLTLDKTCLLSEAITGVKTANDLLDKYMSSSVYTEMLRENVNAIHEAGTAKKNVVKLDKTIDDKLEYEDDSTAADGLLSGKNKKESFNIKTPGCVVKTLERDKIIPLYLEGICLGYYYIKLDIENIIDPSSANYANGYYSITSMFSNSLQSKADNDGDKILKSIAGKISQSIDQTFINSNQDLRKEIYAMLKYNDTFNQVANTVNVNVTFIPPEDIVHFKFNEDPKTHRGQSDLWNGLISAKMWIMMNSTTVIGNVTRSQDKRVYYVKTMVETNVAKTLLNVVDQIKRGNFGIRQMESINNILQISGKFSDFVIPVGPSGDSPITFDIMQGQQFELPVDLMNQLEDSAVSCVVPLEVVNSALNMDFAIRYTMTNGRMLRDTVNRQADCCKVFSKIFTKIFNCEFEDNARIKVNLPLPAFLMITQGSQMIQSATQYIDAIADAEMQGEPDEDRNLFRKLMLRKNLPSYMDIDMIEEVKKEMEVIKSIKKSEKEVKGEEEM